MEGVSTPRGGGRLVVAPTTSTDVRLEFDVDRPIWEVRAQDKIAAQRLDVLAQGAQINVGPAFKFRDRPLIDLQLWCDCGLGEVTGAAHFV